MFFNAPLNIHFIAIGGAVMHNMAIALSKLGHNISGSDDEIEEPSASRLKALGLFPESLGWHPERIHAQTDLVILGMHAKKDNPELVMSKSLGVKVLSYPEVVYEVAKNKQRVVIGGSHGKTTISSMIMHVMQYHRQDFDYLVGAQIEGFDTMVSFSKSAPVMIIEGDEYPASPLDLRPKFHVYQHHIGVISGISWDHINIFKTFDNYVDQFRIFADKTPVAGRLIYNKADKLTSKICSTERYCVKSLGYNAHPSKTKDGHESLKTKAGVVDIKVFGEHNMQNIQAALEVCKVIGLKESQFYEAIPSFTGAQKRLEKVAESSDCSLFVDFAHSPSKVSASIKAARNLYPKRKLIACLELHTFSSLDKQFLTQYKNSFKYASVPIVYYNPEVIRHKNLEPISADELKAAFGARDLVVFTNSGQLRSYLHELKAANQTLLMMSSGTFDGLDMKDLAQFMVG